MAPFRLPGTSAIWSLSGAKRTTCDTECREVLDMGYFDALTSSYFKPAADGRKLFFPWGVMGKGYVIASEQNYQRLQRQCKTYSIVGLILILGASLYGFLWGLFAAALLIALYIGWARYLLRDLQVSNEKLSLIESMKSQALAHRGWELWLLTVCSFVFVICGIVAIIIDPRNWLAGVGAIAFFGFGAAVFLRMIVLR